MKRTATALAVVAVTSLVLTSCGRDDAGGGGEAQSTEVAEGAATGTIEVWAMGIEGEELQAFSAEGISLECSIERGTP